LTLFISTIIFSGCSKKEIEFNKSADYWYDKFIDKLPSGILDDSDDYYSSLNSEHPNSPLTKKAVLILANAHMAQGEYQLANGFLDEYIKRHANKEQIEFARYLKIKVNYNSFEQKFRNQKLLDETITSSEKFYEMYPSSKYIPLVETMVTNMKLARESLNKEIMALYKKLDKPNGVKAYEERLDPALKDIKQTEVKTNMFRRVFE
jgi:outer membrane protein assembly factor BamD